MSENKLIRNSTTEFLIFTAQDGENSIEARYEDETIWLTQKLMGELFEVGTNTINYHLKEIFKNSELEEKKTVRKFRIVQIEGKREVERTIDFYNFDAIISVGYRVNSVRATQFRQWATKVLREFALKGFVLYKKRMENGSFLGKDYFEELLAEERAKRKIPMTMQDWAERLDLFLKYDDRAILKDNGKITAKIAKDKTETEFEKYHIVQDHLFESDFDKEIRKQLKEGGSNE